MDHGILRGMTFKARKNDGPSNLVSHVVVPLHRLRYDTFTRRHIMDQAYSPSYSIFAA